MRRVLRELLCYAVFAALLLSAIALNHELFLLVALILALVILGYLSRP